MHRVKSTPRRVLPVLMALCAAGALACGLFLMAGSREYAEGDAVYQQVRQVRTPQAAAQQALPGESPPPEAAAEEADAVDFSALAEINPDVVAWLSAPGTEIDYPVVLGTDNAYYLTHLFTGEQNKLGAIFLDYRSSGDFSDRNTVVYGHNMKDGSMFSSLTSYREQSYYDRFPAMLLDTPAGGYQIELFAGMVVDGNQESIRFRFADDLEFQDYVDSLKAASSFASDTAVSAGDRIITLCTCSYEFSNARYALFGKLTPIQTP